MGRKKDKNSSGKVLIAATVISLAQQASKKEEEARRSAQRTSNRGNEVRMSVQQTSKPSTKMPKATWYVLMAFLVFLIATVLLPTMLVLMISLSILSLYFYWKTY